MSNLFVCPLTSGMSVVMRLEQWCQSSLLRVCELSGCRILSTVVGKISFFFFARFEALISMLLNFRVIRVVTSGRGIGTCFCPSAAVFLCHCAPYSFRWHVALGSALSLVRSPDGLIRPVGDAWNGGRMRQDSQTVIDGLVAKFQSIMLPPS
jgi:hypothetical protein